MRSHETILHSHLECRSKDDVEQDIQENFAEDVVIIDSHRTYKGHDGVR